MSTRTLESYCSIRNSSWPEDTAYPSGGEKRNGGGQAEEQKEGGTNWARHLLSPELLGWEKQSQHWWCLFKFSLLVFLLCFGNPEFSLCSFAQVSLEWICPVGMAGCGQALLLKKSKQYLSYGVLTGSGLHGPRFKIAASSLLIVSILPTPYPPLLRPQLKLDFSPCVLKSHGSDLITRNHLGGLRKKANLRQPEKSEHWWDIWY